MNPKVSIILTTHGTAPYLKQAIGSVLAQTFENWECILAIDGMQHGGTGINLQWHYNEMRFRQLWVNVPKDNPCRFAYTINRAFRDCRGDYITYLCHDDLYLPWRLEQMILLFEAIDVPHIRRDVVFGYQQLITEHQGKSYMAAYPSLERIRKGNPDQPAGTVDHSSVMHRRECFEKAGGWDEAAPARYGDAYFWNRLLASGYEFHCIPEVLDAHRFNPHSVSYLLDHPVQP